MTILDQILNRTNKGPVAVPTPEWPEVDGTLSVRRLSPMDRVAFDMQAAEQQIPSGAAFVTFVAAWCTIVTADGSRAFADGEWKTLVDDPGSGGAIERLFETADELNVLTAAARERLKKNSARAGDSETTCGSRGTSE
jgi:hypothetical protein